jgi:hypothetical protein
LGSYVTIQGMDRSTPHRSKFLVDLNAVKDSVIEDLPDVGYGFFYGLPGAPRNQRDGLWQVQLARCQASDLLQLT